jgi:lipid-binding SYLF domain-containing protein
MFRKQFLFAMMVFLAAAPPAARADDKVSGEVDRLDRARVTFRQIRDAKDEKIPRKLLDQARCLAVFPGVVKAALGVGGRHGKGVMSCRDAQGHWGPPVFLTMSGGSFGFQAGVEKADVVLFFMDDKSAQGMLESKYTLGAKAGLAAGPVGRTAEADTDVKLDAEIYSYARSKGLFAGISLEGARVSPDDKSTRSFYGANAEAGAIVFQHRAPRVPAAATAFMNSLP